MAAPRPSPPRPSPPRPPVRAQVPTNGGAQHCPAEGKNTCTVTGLRVTVQFKDAEKHPHSPQLFANQSLYRRPFNARGIDGMVRQLLGRYDLIIDAVASPSDAHPPELHELQANIHAEGSYLGNCTVHQHALLEGITTESRGHTTVVGNRTTRQGQGATRLVLDRTANSPPIPMLDAGAHRDGVNATRNPEHQVSGAGFSGVRDIFALIGAMMSACSPHCEVITASSCGVKTPGKPDGTTALLCLVRVFRNDHWAVGFKVPALAEFTHTQAGNRDLHNNMIDRSHQSEGRFFRSSTGSAGATTRGGLTTATRTRGTANGEVSTTTSTRAGGAGRQQVTTVTHRGERTTRTTGSAGGANIGSPKIKHMEDELAHSNTITVIVQHNEDTLQLGPTYDSIKKGIEDLRTALKDIQRLFHAMPQVGWKFTFTISALEGTLVTEWGPTVGPVLAGGRYASLGWEGCIKIELELIKVKLQLSFGVDAEKWGTGLIINASGSIELNAKLSVAQSFSAPELTIPFHIGAVSRLEGHAQVSAAGYTLLNAEASLQFPLFLDAKFVFDWGRHESALTGKLYSNPLKFTGSIRGPGGAVHEYEQELMRGVLIKQF